MIRKYLLIIVLQSMVLAGSAQEYWSGTKNFSSSISRTGITQIGTLNLRTNTLDDGVIEHLATTGNFYLRSVASSSSGAVGNLILNDIGGNVGIGTANPAALLHVAQANVSNVPRAPIVLSRYWLNDSNTRASAFFHYSDGVDEKLVFSVAGLGGSYATPVSLSQAKMVVQANGNVGIGTSQPKDKLSVNGVIRAKEIKVTSAAVDWPDYVFEDRYRLPHLQELEVQIKTKKHLPGMPSAATLNKEGIDIGKMLQLQQKKIEELTLYLIEQQKEISKLFHLTEQLQNKLSHEK